MEAMLLYGGLYVDTDVIALRSLDALLNYTVTMGRDAPSTISNGVILARRAAPHLYLLHSSYTSFKTEEWSAHSTVGNQAIHAKCPMFLHVEPDSLIVPNYFARKSLFDSSVSLQLTKAYMIHFWWRVVPFELDPVRILTWNCPAATVLRNTYFGTT